LKNAETVIEEWIETARELARPIPEPKGRLLFA
jgi:predicted RNase H-like HicB family nuclease